MWKCKKCGGEMEAALYALYEREESYDMKITKEKNLLLVEPSCDVFGVYCKDCNNGISDLRKLDDIAEWEEE